jgi:DNA-binding transcriptional MerR regulator
MKLYRIGELSKVAGISQRTIDYYTKLGLISPEKRTQKNYRLYHSETLKRLKRIHQMKAQKYTLEEIKEKLLKWNQVSPEEQINEKLTSLELHMQQLEKEVKELEPLISNLKPNQARRAYSHLTPQSIACIEALQFLLNNSNPFS